MRNRQSVWPSPWAGAAFPALTSLVSDPDSTVRHYAIGTLAVIGKGNAEVIRLLRGAMTNSTNLETRAVVARALSDLGETAETKANADAR